LRTFDAFEFSFALSSSLERWSNNEKSSRVDDFENNNPDELLFSFLSAITDDPFHQDLVTVYQIGEENLPIMITGAVVMVSKCFLKRLYRS